MTKTIWINEQIDPCGIVYSCIACYDEAQARECHTTFEQDLTEDQRLEGWTACLRTVESWDDVPVTALKISY